MKALFKMAPLFVFGCLLLGCGDKTMVGDTGPGLSIRASADRVFVGETVTIVAKTKNTLGKDSRVDWHSSTGDLKTAEEGRRAQIAFNAAGSYRVDATLIVDGHEVGHDAVTIDVKPLP